MPTIPRSQTATVEDWRIVERVWHSPTLTTWLSFLARSLGLLLLTPVVAIRLDPTEVAVWFVFLTLISLQSIADFGFAPTFSRAIAYGMAGISTLDQMETESSPRRLSDKPNGPLIRSVVIAMKSLYGKLSLLAMLLLGIFGSWALLRPISHVPRPLEAWSAWVVVIASIAFTFWGSYLNAYLQGVNQIAILRRWEAVWAIVGVLVTSVVALLGLGLLAIVVSMQLFSVLAILWNYRLVAHLQLEHLSSESSSIANNQIFQYVWPAAWRSGLGVLFTYLLMYYGPSLIYAQSDDPRSVVAFLFSMRLMVAIAQFSQAPFYSKIPSMARLFAAGQREQVVTLAIRGMRFSYLVFFVGVLLAPLFGTMLQQFATDNIEFVPPYFWSLLAIGFFFERWSAMNLQLYSLSNQIVWHIANGLTGLIFLASSAALWPWLDVLAFPVSLVIAGISFYLPFALWHAHRLFQIPSWRHEWKTFALPIVGLLVAFSWAAHGWN